MNKYIDSFKAQNVNNVPFDDLILAMKSVVESYGTILYNEEGVSKSLQLGDLIIDISTMLRASDFDGYWMVRNMGTEMTRNENPIGSVRFAYHQEDTHVIYHITNDNGKWNMTLIEEISKVPLI